MVHDFETSRLIAFLTKEGRDRLDSQVCEGSCIPLVSDESGYLGKKTFDQMTNCHTRRNSMRIYDQIGDNALRCERHVFLPVGDTNGTFLTVTRGELVSNLRNTV
jgi:hypothetical protein